MTREDDFGEGAENYMETYDVVVVWHAKTDQLLSETWVTAQGVKLRPVDRPILIDHEGRNGLPLVETETYSVEIERHGDTHQMVSQTWFNQDGKKHRTHDLPAYVHYDEDVGIESGGDLFADQYWYFTHGLENRENGPSAIFVGLGGLVYFESWMHDGKYITNRACRVCRDQNGQVLSKGYSRDGGFGVDRIEPDEWRGSEPRP